MGYNERNAVDDGKLSLTLMARTQQDTFLDRGIGPASHRAELQQ
jgi:hypothetical protein